MWGVGTGGKGKMCFKQCRVSSITFHWSICGFVSALMSYNQDKSQTKRLGLNKSRREVCLSRFLIVWKLNICQRLGGLWPHTLGAGASGLMTLWNGLKETFSGKTPRSSLLSNATAFLPIRIPRLILSWASEQVSLPPTTSTLTLVHHIMLLFQSLLKELKTHWNCPSILVGIFKFWIFCFFQSNFIATILPQVIFLIFLNVNSFMEAYMQKKVTWWILYKIFMCPTRSWNGI